LIDRVGVKLGLKFPCGKELEKLAENKTDTITLPVSVNGTEINFSGAETQADEAGCHGGKHSGRGIGLRCPHGFKGD
jgi:tRNA A37 threonylcarbamoyltransferase TsaD